MGALEASRDMGTGQEASRAAPVLGPTTEQGAQVAMADPPPRPQPPPQPLRLEPYYSSPPQKKMSLLGVGSSIGHLGALCRRGH